MKAYFIVDDFKVYYDDKFRPQIHEINGEQFININLTTLRKIVKRLEEMDKK